MPPHGLLEVAANSVASAMAAQAGGAGRVELCGSLAEGGVTPSHGTIAMTRERVSIPLYVLIRPRGGDFLYDADEYEAMRRDIEHCVAMGCDGVVVGGLTADGRVDVERCRALVEAAGTLGVTFHRAIDMARDPIEALDAVIALGCERVLTSGGHASAMLGASTIADMVQHAGARLVVMPGAGVTASNISELRLLTGAREFHASARHTLPSGMRYRNTGLDEMHEGELRSDTGQIRALVAALA
jgi:copper homeostasis protein